jgi:crotonobetainyl-CoA:carnitine CoA-transferase CaiB-like acyl-CoA transferase
MVATADTYATKDGYLSIGANHQHQFEAMCKALGHADLLADPRFADHAARSQNNDLLRAMLERFFAEQSAAELEQKLAAVGVPVAKVRDIPEILQHPHIAARDLFVEATVPGLDRPLRLAGSGFRFGDDAPLRRAAVPAIGQHTAEVLREIGLEA